MKEVSYFPGMPKFTAYVRGRGYRFRLVKDESPTRSTDEAVYDVYFDGRQTGRFAIRRSGGIIERNLLPTYPNGQIVSFGGGGTLVDDWFRQANEWASVIWHRLTGKQVTSAN